MPQKIKRIISALLCLALLFEQSGLAQSAGELNFAGRALASSRILIPDKFRPLHLRYLSYDNLANNFKLLLDQGDAVPQAKPQLSQSVKTLLDYFSVGVSYRTSHSG